MPKFKVVNTCSKKYLPMYTLIPKKYCKWN